MNAVDSIRFKVVVCRLEQLEKDHAAAMLNLSLDKKLVEWIDWEMSELWIEKATLERRNGYQCGRVLFT